MKIGDLIAFRIRDETYLHENSSVQSFWEKYVKPKPDKKTLVTHCMFCGEESPIVQRHSIDFYVSSERTKIISANKNAYESHGNKHSTVAPTCYTCEQKYGQALEYLLKNKPNTPYGKHMFKVGDVTYVYWIRQNQKTRVDEAKISEALMNIGKDDNQSNVQINNLDEMKNQFNRVFGKQQDMYNFNNFCLLILSANKGRLVVRDYIEQSMGTIHDRILHFLEAQNIGNNRLYGIYTLAGTIYRKPSTQLQKIDVRDWFNWIFQEHPLPGRILITLMKRIQADGAMYGQHAAVLKSWLISQQKGGNWTVLLDNQNRDTSYLLGRTFAVLERIHQEAINSKETLGSRFFGSASTTPRAIFGLLIRNAQYHLMKIKNEKTGLFINLDKQLTSLLAKIRSFPTTLTLEKQAEFALGYYYQKEELWKKKGDK